MKKTFTLLLFLVLALTSVAQDTNRHVSASNMAR